MQPDEAYALVMKVMRLKRSYVVKNGKQSVGDPCPPDVAVLDARAAGYWDGLVTGPLTDGLWRDF